MTVLVLEYFDWVAGLESKESEAKPAEREEPKEPYTQIELAILDALRGKALIGEDLLEAIGKGSSNLQWLSKLVSPQSRLYKEGLVRNKRGRGYYCPRHPPQDL